MNLTTATRAARSSTTEGLPRATEARRSQGQRRRVHSFALRGYAVAMIPVRAEIAGLSLAVGSSIDVATRDEHRAALLAPFGNSTEAA